MNKIVFLALTGLIVSQAQADPLVNGPYVALKGGAENMHFSSEETRGSKTVFAFLMALGARAKSFRAEIEWANLTRAVIKKTKYEQQRCMAQIYYDFPIRSVFRPYLNLGAGLAFTDVSDKGTDTSRSDDDTTFAWNAGAGIGLNLTRSWTLDLGYRYVDGGRAKIYDNLRIRNRNHEVYFGGRYTF